jgi:hypothetical protein
MTVADVYVHYCTCVDVNQCRQTVVEVLMPEADREVGAAAASCASPDISSLAEKTIATYLLYQFRYIEEDYIYD